MENTPTKKKSPRKTRVTLSRRDQFRLTQYTLDEYTKSGLNDYEFADLAGKTLVIEGVNDNHIKGIRGEFSILSNTKVVLTTGAGIAITQQMFDDLTLRIGALEKQVRKLFALTEPQVESAGKQG